MTLRELYDRVPECDKDLELLVADQYIGCTKVYNSFSSDSKHLFLNVDYGKDEEDL